MAVPQIPSSHICCFHILPPSPSLYLILTSSFFFPHCYSSTSLLYLPLSLSPLKLPDLFISLLNYLTFSSTSLSFLPLELSIFSSPQLIVPLIFYLNHVVGFFFSFPVFPMVLLLFESERCIFSPLVFLFIFYCCIHLLTLSCMSLWIII